jgi:hypothetical protein
MMQAAQIGEPAAQQPSLVLDTALRAFAEQSGLLGNRRVQSPALTNSPEFAEDEVWLLDFLRKRFVSAQSTSRLAILKRHKFTAEGREQRIRASLDALNAPQPITLKLEQWKEVVAEAEEDDED